MPHRITPLSIFSLGLVAAVGLAGTIVFASPVAAADLDPGYADVPPPQQQVTFGSGWYVRGDVGADKDYSLGVLQPANSAASYAGLTQSSRVGYDFTLGGGYAFTNSIRGDIIVDFLQPIDGYENPSYCYDSAKTGCNISGRFDSYDAMVNGYYDFGTWNVITPYVGAGAGMGFGRLTTTLADGTSYYKAAYAYHNLAWALMAGAAIDVYDHTKLDIGYRYLNNGTIYGTKLYYHEIRAGLRYMIDN